MYGENCVVRNYYADAGRPVSSSVGRRGRRRPGCFAPRRSGVIVKAIIRSFIRLTERNFGLRHQAGQRNAGRVRAAGSPLLSALLLVLFAHAFLASATHFHRAERAGAPAANPASSTSRALTESAPGAQDATLHAQCLLCRLQRNFISDLQQSEQQTAATPLALEGGARLAVLSFSDDSFLVLGGRAPPLA